LFLTKTVKRNGLNDKGNLTIKCANAHRDTNYSRDGFTT